MAKFKGGYKNEYARVLMARFFRNTLGYYKGEVSDDDYFDPIVDLYGDAEVEREILARFDREVLVGEVLEQNRESARLRKYDFIDEDFDIRSGVQEFLDGQDNRPLQGQFFEIAKPKDVLPWDFYSASLQRHGGLLKRLVTSKKPGHGAEHQERLPRGGGGKGDSYP